MAPSNLSENARVSQAARALLAARRAVCLTGAGISTPSGIPDFRSPKAGLWNQVDPMVVASIEGFRRHPKAFFDWLNPLVECMAVAQPNPAHLALAELELLGRLRAVITQNIDGLHSAAGSQRVLELHGNLRTATCTACGTRQPADAALQGYLEHHLLPHCARCSGLLKPDIVLYGEMLPYAILMQSQEECQCAQVMLVAGSSLTVTPASDLPLMAHSAGAMLILVNLQPTSIDHLADIVIHADVATMLPAIAAQVRAGLAGTP